MGCEEGRSYLTFSFFCPDSETDTWALGMGQ